MAITPTTSPSTRARPDCQNVTLTNVYIDGFDGTPSGNTDFEVEVSLDIEMVISMAPGLSK
jgi:uncharacterized lipoprotein YmbA